MDNNKINYLHIPLMTNTILTVFNTASVVSEFQTKQTCFLLEKTFFIKTAFVFTFCYLMQIYFKCPFRCSFMWAQHQPTGQYLSFVLMLVCCLNRLLSALVYLVYLANSLWWGSCELWTLLEALFLPLGSHVTKISSFITQIKLHQLKVISFEI